MLRTAHRRRRRKEPTTHELDRPQGRDPRRRPGHPLPAGDQGHAQGDAAGGGPPGHPVRGRGGRRRPASTTSCSCRRPTRRRSRTTSTGPTSWSAGWRTRARTPRSRPSRALAELAQVHVVRQGEPMGLGHAVAMARRHVGDEPFAVLAARRPHGRRGRAAAGHDRHARPTPGASVVALKEVAMSEISSYGCAAVGERHGPVATITSTGGEAQARGRAVQPGRDGPLRVHPDRVRRAGAGAARASAARSSSPTPWTP